MWMNEWEIQDKFLTHGNHPILGPAIRTISNLQEWANRNSDGWAHWPKPGRAAERLMKMVYRYESELRPGGRLYVAMSDEEIENIQCEYRCEFRKALVPIKAFRTRQDADFEIVEIGQKPVDYRVTVDYGDDRIRTYKVSAMNLADAQQAGYIVAHGLISVRARDDADEFDESEFDNTFSAP